MQCDENIVLERKGKGDRLREIEEFRQRGTENKELSRIGRYVKISKILKELTEKDRLRDMEEVEQ